MKTLKTKISILSIALFASSILFISCSKKDDPIPAPIVYPEENFLQEFLTKSQFNQQTTEAFQTYQHFGIVFTPLVDGKITTLKVVLPAVNPNLKIIIYDFVTQAILRSEIVNISTSNTNFTIDINDLPIAKNRTYMIYYPTTSYFGRYKTGNTEAVFPITCGNIRVDDLKASVSSASIVFPDISFKTGFIGDLSFNFQRTE